MLSNHIHLLLLLILRTFEIIEVIYSESQKYSDRSDFSQNCSKNIPNQVHIVTIFFYEILITLHFLLNSFKNKPKKIIQASSFTKKQKVTSSFSATKVFVQSTCHHIFLQIVRCFCSNSMFSWCVVFFPEVISKQIFIYVKTKLNFSN